VNVLVTGAGGFLGSQIVTQLLAEGHHVRGFSRGHYPDLEARGVELHQGDIRDAEAVMKACTGMDAIIHTAALPGVWGSWKTYYGVNTVGTQHVIEAAVLQQVPQLIYTSSPSVTFSGEDQQGISEDVEYPKKWLCHYPHSKALAEQAVLAANGRSGLATCALRPHLIWGQDDPHLIPRLIQRGRQRKLRIIGDAENLVDIVHVDNAAQAHLCALTALRDNPDSHGKAFWVTQQSPVNCWQWINEILEFAGVPPVTRSIAPSVAYATGATFELVYGILRISKEPPMTRFVARQLSTHHYFDNDRAQNLLGYHPQLPTRTAMENLRDGLQRP